MPHWQENPSPSDERAPTQENGGHRPEERHFQVSNAVLFNTVWPNVRSEVCGRRGGLRPLPVGDAYIFYLKFDDALLTEFLPIAVFRFSVVTPVSPVQFCLLTCPGHSKPVEFCYFVGRLQGSLQKAVQMLGPPARFLSSLAQFLALIAFQCTNPAATLRPLGGGYIKRLLCQLGNEALPQHPSTVTCPRRIAFN